MKEMNKKIKVVFLGLFILPVLLFISCNSTDEILPTKFSEEQIERIEENQQILTQNLSGKDYYFSEKNGLAISEVLESLHVKKLKKVTFEKQSGFGGCIAKVEDETGNVCFLAIDEYGSLETIWKDSLDGELLYGSLGNGFFIKPQKDN